MPNYSYSQSGRVYLATQTGLMTAATLAGTNCCRHTKVGIKANNPRAKRNDKTGTLSQTPGIGGQRSCSVSLSMDVAANGTAGVAPDCDPILQSLFGKAPTIASGSVTYTLADSIVPVTVGHYRLPSSVNQQLAFGVNFQSAKFGFNDGTVAKMSFDGIGVYAPTAFGFAAIADANGKGGLSAFPAEPSSPVTNGTVASGFAGSFVIDTDTVFTLKSATISFSRPIELEYGYGSLYPNSAAPGMRDVRVGLEFFDDDSAMIQDLLTHAENDSVLGLTLVQGNVAGNTWTHTLKGFQLSQPMLDDGSGRRWVAKFDDTSAAASAITVDDEWMLVIT